MSASKICNPAPIEESQRGGQRPMFDQPTTWSPSELNRTPEIAGTLPKADAAVHQTTGESRQSAAAPSEVSSFSPPLPSDPASSIGYGQVEASGGNIGPALQAGKELPAGHHESLSRLATGWPKDAKDRGDSVGLEGVAPAQPTGQPADDTGMMRRQPAGQSPEAEQTNGKPARSWVWWLVVGIALLGLVIGPIGIWLALVWFAGLAQLKSAMAEADAIYPHWRWQDLIHQREQVPPDQNAWPLIEQIAARYRANPRTPAVRSYLRESGGRYFVQHPNRYLPEELEESFQQWIEADTMLPALIEQLRRCCRAQAPVSRLADDLWETELPDVDDVISAHKACRIVHNYYLQKGLDRRAEFVLLDLWKVEEAEDDSLFVLGQSTGFHLQELAVSQLERHLAILEISPKVLKEIRRLLEKRFEKHRQRALLVIRGERALVHEAYKRLQDGRVKWWQFVERLSPPLPGSTEPHDWVLGLGKFVTKKVPRAAMIGIFYVHQHRLYAELLHYHNRLEKAAAKSLEDLERELGAINEEVTGRDDFWWLNQITDGSAFFHPIHVFFYDLKNARLYLQAARAALAAEEFRIEHGRLPTDWNELVSRYLPSVPHDSYASGPLQLKTTADGIVIYSIGEDRRDDGGDPRHDIAFRVYHRDKRGLPPVPFKPPAHP